MKRLALVTGMAVMLTITNVRMGNNFVELIVGAFWLIATVVFYKAFFSMLIGFVRFILNIIKKIWDFLIYGL